MMYNMTIKYFHQILDGLHPVLVVDVREGVQHVPKTSREGVHHVSEVLKININRFTVKN